MTRTAAPDDSPSMELVLTLRGGVAESESTTASARLRALLIAAAAGDSGALGALYDETSPRLYGLALWRCGRVELAEEAVQEVFCRLAAGGVRRPERVRHPLSWLLTMTRNVTLDLVRRRGREVELEASAEGLVVAADPARDSEARTVARSLVRLSPKLREAVYLHLFCDLTFAEAGRVAGVPKFTAASRYRLALRRLRAMHGVET